METLEFYVIRRKDGKYLRAKRQWGEGLKKAKTYTKKGPACGQVTAWADILPDNEIPDLIPLVATLGEPIDQTERVQKSIRTKQLAKAKQELYRAQHNFDVASRELARINSGYAHLNLANAKAEMEKQEKKVKELSTK